MCAWGVLLRAVRAQLSALILPGQYKTNLAVHRPQQKPSTTSDLADQNKGYFMLWPVKIQSGTHGTEQNAKTKHGKSKLSTPDLGPAAPKTAALIERATP